MLLKVLLFVGAMAAAPFVSTVLFRLGLPDYGVAVSLGAAVVVLLMFKAARVAAFGLLVGGAATAAVAAWALDHWGDKV